MEFSAPIRMLDRSVMQIQTDTDTLVLEPVSCRVRYHVHQDSTGVVFLSTVTPILRRCFMRIIHTHAS